MATMSPISVSVDVDALQAGEAEELGDLDLLQRAVALGDGDFVAGVQGAVEDARDGEAAEVVGVVEVGDQDLQGAVGVAGGGRRWSGRWSRTSGCRSSPGTGQVDGRGAGLAVGVERPGKSSWSSCGVEIDEQVVDLVRGLPAGARRGGRSC